MSITPPYGDLDLGFPLQMGNLGPTIPTRDVMDIRKEPSCYMYVWLCFCFSHELFFLFIGLRFYYDFEMDNLLYRYVFAKILWSCGGFKLGRDLHPASAMIIITIRYTNNGPNKIFVRKDWRGSINSFYAFCFPRNWSWFVKSNPTVALTQIFIHWSGVQMDQGWVAFRSQVSPPLLAAKSSITHEKARQWFRGLVVRRAQTYNTNLRCQSWSY